MLSIKLKLQPDQDVEKVSHFLCRLLCHQTHLLIHPGSPRCAAFRWRLSFVPKNYLLHHRCAVTSREAIELILLDPSPVYWTVFPAAVIQNCSCALDKWLSRWWNLVLLLFWSFANCVENVTWLLGSTGEVKRALGVAVCEQGMGPAPQCHKQDVCCALCELPNTVTRATVLCHFFS